METPEHKPVDDQPIKPLTFKQASTRVSPQIPRTSEAEKEAELYAPPGESGKDYAHRRVIDLFVHPNSGNVNYSFLAFAVITASWMVMLYQDNGAKSLNSYSGIAFAALKAFLVTAGVLILAVLARTWRSGVFNRPIKLIGRWCPGHWVVFVTIFALGGGIGLLVYHFFLPHRPVIQYKSKYNSAKEAQKALAEAEADAAIYKAIEKKDSAIRALKNKP